MARWTRWCRSPVAGNECGVQRAVRVDARDVFTIAALVRSEHAANEHPLVVRLQREGADQLAAGVNVYADAGLERVVQRAIRVQPSETVHVVKVVFVRVSTRSKHGPKTISEAILAGLAPDGGLFVPEKLPQMSSAFESESFAVFAAKVLKPFFAGDELEPKLPAICKGAFDFPVPLRMLDMNTAVLELFHGPTCAFKDFGARFLAACLRNLPSPKPRTVLVATSGDTGGAVAAAFVGVPNLRVGILFPKGLISPRQQKQLTTWGGNVRAFAVRGTFDDCQRLVKTAFADSDWPEKRRADVREQHQYRPSPSSGGVFCSRLRAVPSRRGE